MDRTNFSKKPLYQPEMLKAFKKLGDHLKSGQGEGFVMQKGK